MPILTDNPISFEMPVLLFLELINDSCMCWFGVLGLPMSRDQYFYTKAADLPCTKPVVGLTYVQCVDLFVILNIFRLLFQPRVACKGGAT